MESGKSFFNVAFSMLGIALHRAGSFFVEIGVEGKGNCAACRAIRLPRRLFHCRGMQLFQLLRSIRAGRSVGADFSNGDVVDFVDITDLRVVGEPARGVSRASDADRAARAPKVAGRAKTKTMSVDCSARYADLDQRFVQPQHPLIIGLDTGADR